MFNDLFPKTRPTKSPNTFRKSVKTLENIPEAPPEKNESVNKYWKHMFEK